MIKKITLLYFMVLFSGSACAEKSISEIPLSVDSVQTHRVNKNLIRIIQHNMEMLPRLEIQRLSTPDVKLVEKLVIEKIKLQNQVIDFSDSSGTFIDSLVLENGVIKFSIEHSYSGTSGGEIFLDCTLDVKGNQFSQPVCVEKEGE